MKIGSILQKILFKSASLDNTLNPRSYTGLDKRRVLLPLAKKTLRERWPEKISPKNPIGRVALFTGCTMNYILTGTGDATIKTLLKHGIEIIIPRDQSCCGIVAMASGDEATFRSLARSNLKLLSQLNVEAIVVACATCGHTLKDQYLTLLYDEPEEFHDIADMIAGKTYDICEYLINILGIKKIPHKKAQRPDDEIIITYHDPCHLKHGQGIHNEQRKLIEVINGVRLKEMSMPDRCCGGGGSFNLSYYDLSLKILNRKIDDIEKTGADMVLTSCSGCYMQLVDGLSQRSSSTQVKHPVELYYEALKDT